MSRVAITNDDGIDSPGLHALAAAFVEAGHDVVVAAPSRDYSGYGGAIGPLHRTGTVSFERVELDGVRVPAYAIDGPPALASLSVCLGGFGRPPELVVSGINIGANTGSAVFHSATIGAAITAANAGVRAIAVSQAVGPHDTHSHWDVAAALAVHCAAFRGHLLPGEVFNLNVPNAPAEAIAGVCTADLDSGGVVETTMVERDRGVLELHMPKPSISPPVSRERTDSVLLAAGYATLTVLVGVRARFSSTDLAGSVGDALTRATWPDRPERWLPQSKPSLPFDQSRTA